MDEVRNYLKKSTRNNIMAGKQETIFRLVLSTSLGSPFSTDFYIFRKIQESRQQFLVMTSLAN